MSSRKRRRVEQGTETGKKASIGNVSVEILPATDELGPVLCKFSHSACQRHLSIWYHVCSYLCVKRADKNEVSAPGIDLSNATTFDSYVRSRPDRGTTSTFKHDLLLQSQATEQVEYMAHQGDADSNECYLKDYVGVYDPDTGKLQITEARKLVLRSFICSEIVEGPQEVTSRNVSLTTSIDTNDHNFCNSTSLIHYSSNFRLLKVAVLWAWNSELSGPRR